jgi:RNA polymerase sigma-70 factor (ECF subfamily)
MIIRIALQPEALQIFGKVDRPLIVLANPRQRFLLVSQTALLESLLEFRAGDRDLPGIITGPACGRAWFAASACSARARSIAGLVANPKAGAAPGPGLSCESARLTRGMDGHANWITGRNEAVTKRVFDKEADRRRAFNELAETYGVDLYRYAMWICGNDALARDLIQETFLRAWKALESLQDKGAAKSWLITILRREYARTFERKVPQFTDVETIDPPDERELGPDDQAEIRNLREGIMQLPPKYREPLLLQVVMGLSCDEIAEKLNVSKNAVMTQLFRAREQLKERLQRDGVTGNVHGLF